jgi:hypothetical protein
MKFSELGAYGKKRVIDNLFNSTGGFAGCASQETYEDIRREFNITTKEIERVEIKFSKIFKSV